MVFKYTDIMTAVGFKLLEGISLSLGLKRSYFCEKFCNP